MRKEAEMLELITAVAQQDCRISAAYLEGSRANSSAPGDIFQDYDVVYIVDDTRPFIEDKSWIDRFGLRLYMQRPEESVYYTSNTEKSYGWLIQLADGNRLDLHVCTKDTALSSLRLYRVLVDKDGIMPKAIEDSDEIYWVRRPSQGEFACTCNEFWWCLNNVAKGLWRDELPYVMDMIDFHVRPMLRRILEWRIGAETEFSLSVGKSAKYMKRYLDKGAYERYLSTYPRADCEEIWQAVMSMCVLFDETACDVANRLGLVYDLKEAEAAFSYLKHVRELPSDADEVYCLN